MSKRPRIRTAKARIIAIALAASSAGASFGQVQATITLPDSIMAPGAQMKWVKKVAAYCEGPAADPADGTVYFTEQQSNGNLNFPIWKVRPDAPGDTGQRWIPSSNQSNGLFVDAQGRVIAAQKGKFVRYKKDGTADSTLATSGNTATFDLANDFSMGKDGSFYFTENGSNVYYASKGKVTIAATGLNSANGIEWLEAEKAVHVQTTGANRRYDVGADGTLSNPRDFFPVNIGDGCEMDSHGNFYLADYAEGTVFVVNAQGTKIGSIVFNSQASPYDPNPGKRGNIDNCHFGGKDWKTLYCTGDGGLYSVDLKIAGRAWPLTGMTTGLRRAAPLSPRAGPAKAFRADGRWWKDGVPGRWEGPRLPVLPGR